MGVALSTNHTGVRWGVCPSHCSVVAWPLVFVGDATPCSVEQIVLLCPSSAVRRPAARVGRRAFWPWVWWAGACWGPRHTVIAWRARFVGAERWGAHRACGAVSRVPRGCGGMPFWGPHGRRLRTVSVWVAALIRALLPLAINDVADPLPLLHRALCHACAPSSSLSASRGGRCPQQHQPPPVDVARLPAPSPLCSDRSFSSHGNDGPRTGGALALRARCPPISMPQTLDDALLPHVFWRTFWRASPPRPTSLDVLVVVVVVVVSAEVPKARAPLCTVVGRPACPPRRCVPSCFGGGARSGRQSTADSRCSWCLRQTKHQGGCVMWWLTLRLGRVQIGRWSLPPLLGASPDLGT